MSKGFELPDPDAYSDLAGLPCGQNTSGPLVVRYSEEYDRLMSVFRELLERDELSQRALEVCTIINKKVPSNPVAWWFRERILTHLSYDFEKEIQFLNERQIRAPKPFQLWSHRVWLVWQREEPPDEDEFFDDIIAVDEKNFHAWSYFCQFADKFGKEDWLLDKTLGRIQHDTENNSAWSARYYVIQKRGVVSDEELEFTLNLLLLAPKSESTCNYLRGLLKIDSSERVVAKIEERIATLTEQRRLNRHVLALSAHIAELKGETDKYDECIEKIGKIDVIRKNFWALMKSDSDRFEKIWT